ncbi:MAG: 50S ribosomal protein L24 [Candidatus Omnitrophica bacterium CG07_land_8_20_14_0_80_42_15]|uniref:Large ribosomal subunit protein uL24 n=1 Tax=Candidatus Aquitaenariimonas noxiae TaxID=1974741 RepID=A0A2J0L140_9BACT|nr:MAG: 50S ribosomal protein L24 [Candidatus Omnitrophica bacterium CG07_land_8_20_14_0_80_42_15]
MKNIRKNDIVMVMAGKDKGKTGKVLSVFPKKGKALVEGVNFIKKHARRTQQDQQGGIIQKEALINLSNILLYCKTCSKPTRVGVTELTDGTKTRYCKKCNEIIS